MQEVAIAHNQIAVKMKILQIVLLLLTFSLAPCSAQDKPYSVTFIELGSVRCIPCQKMQHVIKQVEDKYPHKVKTVFYDVWTDKGKPYAEKYHIDLIPTQIFLDKNGKEYFRHEGYFSFEELDKILQQKIN